MALRTEYVHGDRPFQAGRVTYKADGQAPGMVMLLGTPSH